MGASKIFVHLHLPQVGQHLLRGAQLERLSLAPWTHCWKLPQPRGVLCQRERNVAQLGAGAGLSYSSCASAAARHAPLESSTIPHTFFFFCHPAILQKPSQSVPRITTNMNWEILRRSWIHFNLLTLIQLKKQHAFFLKLWPGDLGILQLVNKHRKAN